MSQAARKLSPEELEVLWASYKGSGDMDAKNDLLLHYGYLVRWIVRRMMPKYNDYNEYDDLVSCGMIGLIDAVDKFERGREVKFETYAVTRIRGEILDYMRSQDWASPSLRKKINQITNAYEELEREYPDRPVDEDVAAKLEMTVDQVHKILNQSHMFNLVNFEDALGGASAGEADIKNHDEKTPEDELLEKEKKQLLAEAIDELPEKERLMITLYYYEGLLLKEIADIMHVTESRVSQIHSKVLAKMRMKLNKVL